MKIKDLPQPYREMALIEQEAQGNKRDENIELVNAFIFDISICGDIFWWTYPNEITPEIKAKFPSVFKDELTKEQKNYLADVYVNSKSSSDVFREQHKTDFIAGFDKAWSIYTAISSACDCTCSNSLTYENCDKKCKRYIIEQADL